MMLESLQNSDEMWLMYYKWNLRTTCNAILDFSVHANNMSKNKRCICGCGSFQQQAEADGKWNRVTLSQSPALFILLRDTEIYDFRKT
jgi:hypothetical protein